MNKLIVLTIVMVLTLCTLNAQNVGINATGAAPHSSAGLDVNFTDKGFLIPRVALTALNSASPISSPTVSLLVYNTATAGSSPNNVIPGYYYWDGSVWVAQSGHGSKNWSLLGNAGTTAGTNFLGTTDAIDLVFKTNGTERIRATSAGSVSIGNITPSARLDVNSVGNSAGAIALQLRGGNGSGTYTSNQITFGYNGTDEYRHAIKTRHNGGAATDNAFDFYLWKQGTDASTTIGTLPVMTLDGDVKVGFGTISPTSSNSFVGKILEIDNNIGDWNAAINLSTYGTISNPSCMLEFTNRSQTSGDKRTAQISSGRTNTSTTLLDGYLAFNTTTGGVMSTQMFIEGGGDVGIGTTNPNDQLEITKNFRIPVTTGSTVGVINSGSSRYIHNYGSGNVFLGVDAGNFTLTGGGHVGIGVNSLTNNTSGGYNTACGYQALKFNTTGGYNTAFGVEALALNTTANFNTAIGRQALLNNTIGSDNTSAGVYSLYFNTAGSYNTANGNGALFSVTTASFNTGVGNGADVSGGSSNATSVGYGAVSNANDKVRIGNGAVTVVEGPVAYTVSDGRFKSNISETDVKGLEFIKRLRPVVYNFNAQQFQEFLTYHLPDSIRQKYFNGINYDKATAIRQSGFIAQEVEQAMKESGYNFNGVHVPENEHDNYSLAYGQFVVPIIKAMQEQQQTIENQQAIIKVLTEKNENLQSDMSNIKIQYDKRFKALEEIMGVRAQK